MQIIKLEANMTSGLILEGGNFVRKQSRPVKGAAMADIPSFNVSYT